MSEASSQTMRWYQELAKTTTLVVTVTTIMMNNPVTLIATAEPQSRRPWAMEFGPDTATIPKGPQYLYSRM